MKALVSRLTADGWLVGALFVFSVLALTFRGALVAEPKLLFGRSLNAIEPSLFPTIVLAALAILCAFYLVVGRHRFIVPPATGEPPGLLKAFKLFAVLILYALTMVPLGFFISSAVALSLVALIAGNKSILQIAVLATVAPVALYITATRGLAVSLPELSTIEFAYAYVIDR